MAGTTTIPLTNIPNGARTFGPGNVADTDSTSILTIDRTPSGGLNSLTETATIELLVEQSNDGGSTWFLIVDSTIFGGSQVNLHGQTATNSVVGCAFAPGTSRQVRITLTVTNGPIRVQGTLATS